MFRDFIKIDPMPVFGDGLFDWLNIFGLASEGYRFT